MPSLSLGNWNNRSTIEMRLIHPKQMTPRQEEVLKLGLAHSRISLSKEEILRAAKEQLSAVEEGLQMINHNFPIPEGGKIDIVASDSMARLLLVNVMLDLDAKNLAQIFMQSDWMEENKEVFEHFYPNKTFEKEIRLIVLAQNILPDAKSLLKRLDKDISLEIFTCDCFLLSGVRWLVVKRLENENSVLEIRNDILPSEISQEELDDFFIDTKLEKEKGEEEEEITEIR